MYFYYNNDYILTNGDEMENTNKQEHIDETLIKDVVMMVDVYYLNLARKEHV